MNRKERDWAAVRAAIEARMGELGIATPGEAARMAGISDGSLRRFLRGQGSLNEVTVRHVNEKLGLPYDHLSALADRREPKPPSPPRLSDTAASEGKPFAALLSLTDLAPGAQMVADYKAYVVMVASELAEGMTAEQRSNTGSFLSEVARAVRYGKWYV